MRVADSDMMVSIESRDRRIGLVVFLIASETAMVVIEFLDMSPAKIEKSASSMILESLLFLSKDPESVEGSMMVFGKGGSLLFSASGSTILTREIGNLLVINSAVLMVAENDCSLPPIIFTVPVFCSGIFQARSGKSGFWSCFCQ